VATQHSKQSVGIGFAEGMNLILMCCGQGREYVMSRDVAEY
jgi:hypothetical protein